MEPKGVIMKLGDLHEKLGQITERTNKVERLRLQMTYHTTDEAFLKRIEDAIAEEEKWIIFLKNFEMN